MKLILNQNNNLFVTVFQNDRAMGEKDLIWRVQMSDIRLISRLDVVSYQKIIMHHSHLSVILLLN